MNNIQKELKNTLHDFIRNLNYYSMIRDKASIVQAKKSSESRKGQKRTEEQRQRIREASREGRRKMGKTVRVFKQQEEKLISINELDSYLLNGWLRGRTTKCRKILSEERKGKHFSPRTE